MRQAVAFIGAGNMGARMARRLINAGFDVTVCDSNAAVRQAFCDAGATVTERPSQCARADVVIVMVADATQVKEVVTGADGIKGAIDINRPPLIVVMSTVLPADCIALREGLGPDLARIVDAPVSGGLLGAEQGTLAFLAGGAQADIDEAMPVFKALGKEVFHCGALGSGQVAKIVNNMVGITNIYGTPEAFELAARHGMRLETLAPILEAGSGRNFFTEDANRTRGNYKAWSESPEVFASLGEIIRKDLSLAIELAECVGLNVPVLKAISLALAHTPDSMRESWVAIGTRDESAGGGAGK